MRLNGRPAGDVVLFLCAQNRMCSGRWELIERSPIPAESRLGRQRSCDRGNTGIHQNRSRWNRHPIRGPIVGGKGGGKPDNARGGGKDAAKLDEALAKTQTLL